MYCSVIKHGFLVIVITDFTKPVYVRCYRVDFNIVAIGKYKSLQLWDSAIWLSSRNDHHTSSHLNNETHLISMMIQEY